MLKTWNANYDDYCAKNYIGQEFKPASKCIDNRYIYKYNSRVGMKVTVENDELCVELDTSTALSQNYKKYLSVVNPGQSKAKYDMRELQESTNTKGYLNAYDLGETL